ncbi:MAG: M28 family metallopeptidase, partial [Clostridiales bacterium]
DSILDQANGKIILLNYNNQTNVEYLIEKLGSITKGFVVYFGVRSTASSYQESVLNIKYDNGYSNLIGNEGYFECLVNEDVYNEYLSYLENDIEIEFEVYVGYSIELKESKNIIGLYDNKYTDQEIIIGAHYDGVDCPAANDNASGTATMLELARVISENKLNYDIRFIAFGSEELGLHGSSNYVDTLTEDEISNIEYVINLDMVGVGDELGIFKATEESDTELVELADKIAEKNNVNHNVYTMGRSDHVPFDYYGIKSIMLLYQEDLNYHTENDTYENLLESNIENDNIKNVLNLVMRIVNKINCGFQTKSEINEAA